MGRTISAASNRASTFIVTDFIRSASLLFITFDYTNKPGFCQEKKREKPNVVFKIGTLTKILQIFLGKPTKFLHHSRQPSFPYGGSGRGFLTGRTPRSHKY
jgi:hypothetical protein